MAGLVNNVILYQTAVDIDIGKGGFAIQDGIILDHDILGLVAGIARLETEKWIAG